MHTFKSTSLPTQLTTDLISEHVGIEIEEHRVQIPQTRLSRHPHAPALGDRRVEPNYQTDFSESQEELVTNPQQNTTDALAQLHQLQNTLTHYLNADEIIWPLSMPPYLSESDLTFLDTHFERPWYQDYRRFLIEQYGYYQHIMTGIHVNYSLSNQLMNQLIAKRAYPNRNAIYFQTLKQVSTYRWLITYLFGASPLTENPDTDQLLTRRPDITEPVRSWRSSSAGFANHPELALNFSSLDQFFASLNTLIDDGTLFDLSEYYGPVRVKATETYHEQHHHAVEYLEFCLFDLNPYSTDGISDTMLTILELLILDAVFYPQNIDNAKIKESVVKNDSIALQNPETPLTQPLQQELTDLLTRLETLSAIATPDLAAK
ncbi:glutamate--cysteine ligase [Weissella uvarum]|uniref:glutamate--cysteine ligase n=1 Tax=Weissella uvarum TaxID=1479233 RepID=UPI001961D707|nr:glutamate--cysteine ligase [Weissella uvarum]MBM7617002.1 glutamate--cysteine ligase [Weissella uvarum]MCM0595300.1 glutamate--cysteine ligase [Weissella uvarum]